MKKYLIHPIKRRIAKYYLAFLRRFFAIKVVGITGSAGKTSAKEMLASILRLKGATVATYANIDPVYNIPSTILRCSPMTKYLILEMGVEYPKEMDFYLWLAKPDVGVIHNIYPTHTEFLGDVGGVFKEKSKLVRNLPKGGVAVLNKDDKFLRKLGSLRARKVWFGSGTGVMSSKEGYTKNFKTKFLLILDQDPKKRASVKLPILGRQYVSNATGAAAVAHHLGISMTEIRNGLESFKPPEHRMRVIKHKSGALIFDDSYNNNPTAAKGAISTLYGVSRQRDIVIVFGDMLELGNWERKYHMELGEYISKQRSISKLICVGNASEITAESARKLLGKNRVTHVFSWEEAVPILTRLLNRNTAVLIKGSRSIHLEKLVESISVA